MPSASTTQMPLRLRSGSSGTRTPWKSWLVSLAPLSENCPTDIFSSRGIPAFTAKRASPLGRRGSFASKDQAAARDDADREEAAGEDSRFGAVLMWVVYRVM